jgi:hypothetical protein|tara:strand:- start:30 stop:530 length:501 start_codon:yes stop_codon:yes gene_type:complete
MDYLSTEIKSAREAMTIFKILGIKNVSTLRQRKNGTTVYELPISQVWQTLQPKPIRFATYETGYVRNVTEGLSSSYQINKTKPVVYESGMTGKERILIHSWEERIIYLAKFIIKNYYQKTTYVMSDYVMDCLREAYVRDYNNQPSNRLPFGDEVQVIVNGHRYNLS